MSRKRIAVLTGGGDAPGLNAVIHALTRACLNTMQCELIGYKFGYRGLYNNDFMPLDLRTTSGILHTGGSMLYCSNKDNLFKYQVMEGGQKLIKDVSDIAIQNMRKEGVEALVVLGGDGTLTSARDFTRKGVNVVGIPKTIDNDLPGTDQTFGFDTAVGIVTEELGRLHTTAESHHRVIVVEVMGRSAGWIALHAGIAGSADVILLPEFPYSVRKVAEKIEKRNSQGDPFSIIVVGEGCIEAGGEAVIGRVVDDSPDSVRFGGVAAKLAAQLEKLVQNEVRHVALGHIQRGGNSSAFDRLLSTQYGVGAADLIKRGLFGNMVNIRNGEIGYISLEDVIGPEEVSTTGSKVVTPDNPLLIAAKKLGIEFAEAS
ncbi:MAG: ATP-dependent 6-phosphofructokinase [Oscillospiraceae bacterium]|nr:ATP-dependent 6-phosphofructokinase [Oscillospiraceae bacterium]